MVASTDIKFYVHTNNNAPQLPNTWGALANILDACLITGLGSQAVSSTGINNKVLTLTTGTTHNLKVGQVIKLTGATQAEFNKEYRITLVPDATTIQVDLDNSPILTALTGSMSIALPPLGWVKEFTAGGKRAYRNADFIDSDRPFLRVLDEIDPVWGASYAKYAKVGIVDQMIDIDTMIGTQTPYEAAAPNKNWVGTGSGASAYNGWAKWYYARTKDVYETDWYDSEGAENGNKRWLVVGNKDWFYLLPSQVNSVYPNIYFFGKLNTESQRLYGLSSSLQYDTAQNNKATNKKTALSAGAAAFLLHGNNTGNPALSLYNGNRLAPNGPSLFFPDLDASLLLADVYIPFKLSLNPLIKMPALKWLLNPYKDGYDYITVESSKKFFLLKTVFASTAKPSSNESLESLSGLIAFELS